MIKNLITILLAVTIIMTGCSSATTEPSQAQEQEQVKPQDANSSSEVTAGDVAKHIALSPLYVVFGAAALAEKIVIGTGGVIWYTAKKTKDGIASLVSDSNSSK